jgi:OOP family OmpA-OmpF porin
VKTCTWLYSSLALFSIALACHTPWSHAQSRSQPGQVVIAGTVPDEATHMALLNRLRDLYGANAVLDQMTIAAVVVPPQWTPSVQKLLGASLKQISRGELRVEGTQVTVKGEVANEAVRQQLLSEMATALTTTYTVKNALRVSGTEQSILDNALGNRIVEFESGSAILTLAGKAVLDDMALALKKIAGKRVEIIGHTDSSGARSSNLVLSQARADVVKNYLLTKGLSAEYLATAGAGPDRPVADNATVEGRARNRRIEFRIS